MNADLKIFVDFRLRQELLALHKSSNGLSIPKDIHEFDDKMKCSKHSMYMTEISYGLNGGGCGYYTYCVICGDVITKSQDNGV